MQRTLLSAPPTDRVGRYPSHSFQTKELPFTAQPFMLARVLPGETLKTLYFESRVITDPIKNPIVGWKKEYYWFYVRVSDLLLDAVKDMFVDPTNAEIAGMDEAANITRHYAAKGAINWTGKCLERVIDTYFRDDGEVAGDFVTAGGDYIVQIRQNSWLDSLTDKDLISEGDAIAGATDAGDLDRLMDAFEMARSLGLANMSYEDFLRNQGINIPGAEENKPELLDRLGDWQYPSNTIDPATGAPSSAVSWVFRQTLKQPKNFKEPGFIIGISITRPKVYLGGLAGSYAGFAQRAWDWMPYYLMAMPEAALKQFAADTGPLGDRTTATDAYWVDNRDDLLYGDQFQNVFAFDPDLADMTQGAFNMFALPGTDLKWKYPTEAMVKALYSDAATADKQTVRQDGICKLNIKGAVGRSVVDYTVGNIATE